MPTRFHPELDAYVEMPVACTLAAVYVLLGLAGNRFIASREPLQLTIPKLIYNTTQVVVCSITFAKLLPFFTVRRQNRCLLIASCIACVPLVVLGSHAC